MFRYADPHACPICRAPLDHAATHCSTCETPLTGTPAETLWRTLTHADGLVAELLRLAATSTEARTAGAQNDTPFRFEAFPRPEPATAASRQPRSSSGLTSASVPKILLTLGAGCLLVAAIVFLVVAWASFGQTGRTVTLLGVTAAAGAAAAWMVRRGLTSGAESLATVALGMLALDLFGARSAGWMGNPQTTDFVLILGVAVGVAGLAAAWFVHTGSTLPRLVSGEVIGALGLLAATHWVFRFETGAGLALVSITLVVIACAIAARRLTLQLAMAVLAAGAAYWWFWLIALGASRVDEPTLSAVWGGLHCWPLLAAAALALALVPTRLGLPLPLRVLATSAAVTVVASVLTLPAVDEGMTTLALVSLAALAIATGSSLLLTRAWRWIAVVPVGIATICLLSVVLTLTVRAVESLFDFVPWTRTPMGALPGADLPWHLPLMLAPAAVGVLIGAWVAARMVVDLHLRPLLGPMALIGLTSLVLAPSLYGAPRGIALGVLLVAVTAQCLLLGRAQAGPLLPSIALALAIVTATTVLGASFANEVLTAAATGILAAISLALASTQVARPTRVAGEVLFAPLVAGCVWTVLQLSSVDESLRVPVLLVVVGAWAIARPTWWTECAVVVTGLFGATYGLTAHGAVSQGWLALDLTVAGVLVAVSALVNPSRRPVGWVSLGLFTAAQWVRLDQAGVSTVEAYTLPLAAVLLVIGLIRIRVSDISTFRALSSGLVLALLPTLVLALVDPLSLRAALLGLGCAVAVAIGAGMRWSAPLVAGAAVGAVLVLREATMAQILPQWAAIGLTGLVLTTIGITWERRVTELRLATGFLHRLR